MAPDDKILDYFKVIHENCNTIEFTFDKKNSLYIPLFNTSIDHGLSILLLKKQNLTVSCLALARPMVESYLRAMWVKYCLHEDKIIEGCSTMHFPIKLDFLLGEIEKKLPENHLFSGFKSSITPLLVNIHDYTHTGIQSIVRQYDYNKNLTNENCFDEVSELIKLVVLVTSLSYEELIPVMDNSLSHTDIYKSAMELIEL
ncbi:hypothetical protein ABIS04_16310 [Shewanella sp. H8]|uniref:DUF6988 family protein n=1 Tax=Shewanella sp. H8 TaxID=3342676 RepID=UPI0033155ED9